MIKRKIAIVAGGDNSEYHVKLKSAEGLYSFIDKSKYEVYLVEILEGKWQVKLENNSCLPINRHDFSFVSEGKSIHFDFAYITIHGTPGENGVLQGYFDLLQIPYSTCDVFASALTFDKFACNHYLKGFGVKSAESLLLKKGQELSNQDLIDIVGLPCFIKPNLGGSSFGITKVKEEDEIQPALLKAFGESDQVIIEMFIPGREVTCGCYKTADKQVIFPLSEVVTHNEFFDYDAKYNGEVEEITPAELPEGVTTRIQSITSAIYDIIGCSGIIRADFIITDENVINLLEVNTTPGMTATSFIPQQVKAAGLEMRDVMSDIIENKLQ